MTVQPAVRTIVVSLRVAGQIGIQIKQLPWPGERDKLG